MADGVDDRGRAAASSYAAAALAASAAALVVLAVLGAERLVISAGVGGSVASLTVVALATASESVALIPAALRRGIPELAAAGILGSVIDNATAALGVAALARPLAADDVTLAAASTVGLGAIAWIRGRIARTAPSCCCRATWPTSGCCVTRVHG
ncbi:MAG: hypothetical protein KY462_08865 [Actinobacteria bacterium]|nr:hypothetical protein [Actinomycetota bacterium]